MNGWENLNYELGIERVNIIMLRVGRTNLLSQRLMINMLDDTDFGVKVDFCGQRKTG